MSIFKKIVYMFFQISGFNAVARSCGTNSLYVIMYHSVSNLSDSANPAKNLYPHISIDSKAFEAQMKMLAHHGHSFIRFQDIPRIQREHISKPTIIYFDDGYKDNLTVALPILKKYKIPATIFVTTGLINRTHLLWTIELRALLTEKGISPIEQVKIIDRLKTLSDIDSRAEIVKKYGALSSEMRQQIGNLYLNWDEVRQLAREGVEIGSHAVSHSRLTECSDEQLMNELRGSKEEIESQLGGPVFSFSYPHGRWNDRVNSALEKAGYTFVTSVGSGLQSIQGTLKKPLFV